jgi:hypothetical protein
VEGRYTAQQYFQSQQFQEANSGATNPYTAKAYQCPWSQRAYLFQFDSYQQRIQFDAANTSCCNEQIRPFDRKPQYAEIGNPPRVSDCGAKATVGGCNIMTLEDNGKAPCGEQFGGGVQTGILIKCPNICDDLVGLQAGTVIRGNHGEFQYAGQSTPDVIELRYVPDSDVQYDAWSTCQTQTFTEMLCSDLPITISLQAGPTKPAGCDCDCCGNIPATGGLTQGGCFQVSGGYANYVDCTGAWVISHHCSGQGEIQKLYWTSGHYLSSSEHISWTDGPNSLYDGGGWWYSSGIPGQVGDGDYPACCGLSGVHTYSRGCGEGEVVTSINFSAKKPAATNIYASHSPYAHNYYSGGVVLNTTTMNPASYEKFISGYQACPWSNKAALEISGWSGLATTYGSLQRLSGRLVRSLGVFAWDSDRDGQCCGFGSFSAYFNNGCDDTYSGIIMVRKPVTADYEMQRIGHALKCTATGNPEEYKVQEAPLYCGGSVGEFTDGDFSYIVSTPGLEACNSVIGSGGGIIRYDDWPYKACRSGEDPSCCYYSQNGSGGVDFRVYIWQGLGTELCCPDIPKVAGYYVRESVDCCPAKTGDPWN